MKYEIGHIYVIWDCEDHNLVYYGSTNMIFEERMKRHKNQGNKCSSKQVIERGNYEYTILETYENIDEYDLVERERWYILNKVCVNQVVPHRTKAEWYQDNKEKIKEYYQDNKEKIAERHKEYRQNNKEKLKEQKKQNYEQNRDKISQINKQKVRCPYCDKEMIKASLTRHIKQFCKGQNHSSTLT